MSPALLVITIILPIAGGAALYLPPIRAEYVRRKFIAAVVLINSALVWALVLWCTEDAYPLFSITPKLVVMFRFDGLGRFFGAMVATLWPLTTYYAFEYLSREKFPTGFYMFFLFSYAATLGIAMAGDLITMYCFYELLTLSTMPLVMHTMTKAAIRASKIYLACMLGGSAFAFIGMAVLIACGVPTDFAAGGLAAVGVSAVGGAYLIIFIMAFIGFSVKAAIFPIHDWLIKASVAPTPVTALLHAVAVVKAGVFAGMRLTYYCFGTDILRGTWAQYTVMALAAVTIFYGSSMALKEGHFKRRLAYSTVANLSYILFGVTLMNAAGFSAALMHMLFHALIKILAFFCCGAVLHNTEREFLPELNGLAGRMPVTFACFTVSALALTGFPPLNGFFSKWNLIEAALQSGGGMEIVGAVVILVSALLTAMYMLSVVVRGYFMPPDEKLVSFEGRLEVNAYMWVPIVIISVMVIATGVWAVQIENITDAISATVFG